MLVGQSGSGKSTIARMLRQLGYKELISYTTRKPRYEGEDTHIFITEEEYQKFKQSNEIVAYTYFDSHHYFATKQQIYNSDIYVIDPDGVEYLKEKIKDINFVTIHIKTSFLKRIWRMLKRGDSLIKIIKRIKNDRIKFKDIQADYVVTNDNLNIALGNIATIISAVRMYGKRND